MKVRKNIIFIVADSLRYDYVGAQNGERSLTPHLDRLSKESVVFDQAISQGPSTRVSMSAMMSSTYASMYGGPKKLSSSRPVIQAILKEVGYLTAGITSNLYLSRSFGWARGFDHYDDCRPEAIYHRKIWMRIINQFAKLLRIPLGWPKALPAELVFENAQTFLRRSQSPFFLWVHLMDTHWPYSIQRFSWGSKWRRKHRQDEILRPRLISRPPNITLEEHNQLLTEYREAVQYLDGQIGAFVQDLNRKGILSGSWLVVTADHGEEFKEHGQYFHHPTLFDELVHVPLIIRPPDNTPVEKGRRHRGQVRLIDLVPTFLEIARTKSSLDQVISGTTLMPILYGDDSKSDRPAIIESPENQTLAARSDNWKYIWHPNSDLRLLFDLDKDPFEQRNLLNAEQLRVAMMHVELENHLKMIHESKTEDSEIEAEFKLDQAVVEQLRGLGYIE